MVQKKRQKGPTPVTHKLAADFREEARRETGIPTIPNEEITARARLGGEKAKSKHAERFAWGDALPWTGSLPPCPQADPEIQAPRLFVNR